MRKILYRTLLLWLKFWAKLVLRRVNPFIVGVTGSAGKSSAAAAIAPVLKLKFKNLKIAEKANSESGIPADILGLHFGQSPLPILDWLRILLLAPLRALHSVFSIQYSVFDCYLVEMGIDEPIPPKNMGYLLTILKPDIGVILNALPVHTEQFERSGPAQRGLTLIESIAAEKGKLITENQNLGWAVLNADQPEIASLKPANESRVVTFGKGKSANVVIKSVTPSLDGTSISFYIQRPGLATAARPGLIRLPNIALPEFYGYTIAAALAVASALNINLQDAGNEISKNFKLPPGRGQVFAGIKNTKIIDSSYNASAETMINSLKLLTAIAGRKTKIAVLGDMRELGTMAKTEHQKVAQAAVKIADKIILIGPLMNQYALPLIKQSKVPVNWFSTAGEAANYLTMNLSGKEIILVKGSQNTIFLEIVVEALLKNKSDISNLCRRGPFWDKKRKPFN